MSTKNTYPIEEEISPEEKLKREYTPGTDEYAKRSLQCVMAQKMDETTFPKAMDFLKQISDEGDREVLKDSVNRWVADGRK